MEKFDSCRGKFRIFDVMFTLQSGEYKGSIVTQIQGNISPYEALKHLDSGCVAINPEQSDCDFHESEDYEGNWWFEATLKNTEGETCHIENECCYLEDYIVAAEIMKEKKMTECKMKYEDMMNALEEAVRSSNVLSGNNEQQVLEFISELRYSEAGWGVWDDID